MLTIEVVKPSRDVLNHVNDVLNTDKPPFGGNANEYRNYFESLFHIKTFETCYNSNT